MSLLERVATLIRANLNDLIDRAEDPEKMLKQLILDMQNQLIQVKTQVAIAIADQHVLRMKLQENNEAGLEWLKKAEIAVEEKQDDLARPALERVLSYKQRSAKFEQQLQDHSAQVENLTTALQKLEQKLIEAKRQGDKSPSSGLRSHEQQCPERRGSEPANNEIAAGDSHDDEVDLLLQEIKAKKNVTAILDR